MRVSTTQRPISLVLFLSRFSLSFSCILYRCISLGIAQSATCSPFENVFYLHMFAVGWYASPHMRINENDVSTGHNLARGIRGGNKI